MRLYVIVPTAIIAVLVGAAVALRLVTPKSQKTTVVPLATAPQVTAEEVRDALRKASDFETFRGTIQLLNAFLERNSESREERRLSLSKEEQELLKTSYYLDESELAEINRGSFTVLDGHYLALSFLLRDGLRSLRVERLAPLHQAATGFAWVMRQVRLSDSSGDSLPPHFVLRRGWGTAQERALVFLALLEQLGIDSCMVAIPGGERGDAALRYWVAGALVGKDIYLFDTRLGLPLPGPKGQEIATLAQVRKEPELLKRLTVDAKYPYDVTQQQARQTEVHLAASLSALAPRMRYLQEAVFGGEGIHLGVDPAGLWQRFQTACKKPDLAETRLRVWNLPGDSNTPTRVLRYFLPKEEGGVDPSGRREQARMQLVPWPYYPRELKLPGPPGEGLAKVFEKPFIAFSLEARLPKDLLPVWLPGLVETKQESPAAAGARKASPTLVLERMPRDLVLRGRFEEATPVLVAIRDELKRQKANLTALNQEGDLDEKIRAWSERAVRIVSAFAQAQQDGRNPKKAAAAAVDLDRAKKELAELEKTSQQVIAVVQAAAAEPMSREVAYLLALSKQEQAERAQARLETPGQKSKTAAPADVQAARNAWRSAADWWLNYLSEFEASGLAPAARLHLARCRQALDERAEAVNLLENLSGETLTPLEKTARLYLAKQLTR